MYEPSPPNDTYILLNSNMMLASRTELLQGVLVVPSVKLYEF